MKKYNTVSCDFPYKANGIVAEYNPFHNGHLFQLTDAREKTGADYTIVVMSGNFTQRGTPALINKYDRARMALQCGADLVLELPILYAASSAEFFATGAVSMLDKLGVTDYLCFGSECGDLTILQHIADILAKEPPEYTSHLKSSLRQGMSYPIARTDALIHTDPSLNDCDDILKSANNILAIEYLKALKRRKSSILPVTTLRNTSGYHDRMMNQYFSSALALRQAVYDNCDPGIFASQMPPQAYEILADALQNQSVLQLNDLSSQLHYKLLSLTDTGYSQYLDVSEDLSDRIRKHLYHFKDYRSFCDLLKTKELTYTRISRCLLHILLDITKEDMILAKEHDYICYARVLGFQRDAAPLLSEIKKRSSIPMITKLSDAENNLPEDVFAYLKKEQRMNTIYAGCMSNHSAQPMQNEYSTPLVIL